MLQKQLKYGFVAQAGYVGTRQVHQQYEINVNNGQVLGAGTAGEPLNQLFGRTATTNFFEPWGHSHYDALQATLSRRFKGGYQIAANYSFSKSITLCCADKDDSGPAISIPGLPTTEPVCRSIRPDAGIHLFRNRGTAVWPRQKQAEPRWFYHGARFRLAAQRVTKLLHRAAGRSR